MSRIQGKLVRFVLDWFSLHRPENRLLVIAVGITLLLFLPPQRLEKLPSINLWHQIWGYCPATGSLRALSAFFRGDVNAALSYNINVLATGPLILLLFAMDLYRVTGKFMTAKQLAIWLGSKPNEQKTPL